MASVDEINAAFDAIEADIRELILKFVPVFYRGSAEAQLGAHRRDMVEGVKKALEAAETVRAAAKKEGASTPDD